MADQENADQITGSDRRRQLEEELARLRAQKHEVESTFDTDNPRGDSGDQADEIERGSELTWIDDRITELSDLLEHGVGEDARAGDRVEVGSQVVLEFSDGNRETLLVGDVALDTGQSTVLTPDSPLGRAILGHRAGDTVTYPAPSGPTRATVIEIHAS
jgi:transcription elongation GreA/GreB family factor